MVTNVVGVVVMVFVFGLVGLLNHGAHVEADHAVFNSVGRGLEIVESDWTTNERDFTLEFLQERIGEFNFSSVSIVGRDGDAASGGILGCVSGLHS